MTKHAIGPVFIYEEMIISVRVISRKINIEAAFLIAVLIWNMRDESDPLNQELYRIFIEYCPDFKGFGGGIVKDDPRIKLFFNSQYDYISFDNPLYYDREKFIARSLSGSYSLKEGDRGFDDYFKEIESIFNKYVRDGIISIGNRSVAYIGKI